jgi:hypothetical protein
MGGSLSEEERALLEKIAGVKKKKGGVNPTIIVYRDENQPIQIILRAVKPPVITGDYVSVSVSDSDFTRIMRVFQQIQEAKVSMSRSFQTAEGGMAYSEMEYYSSLEIVERFIQDIYGVEKFFRHELDSRFERIQLMKKIHAIVFEKWQQDPSILERKPQTSVFPLIDNIKWFSIDEFEQYVLPFVEAAFLWECNKDLGLTTSEFREVVSRKLRKGDQSALYGHLSETYVSGLYIFGGWSPRYIEKLDQGNSQKQIEWIFQKGNEYKIGVECKDHRQRMQGQNQVSLVYIQGKVDEAIEKFSAKAAKSLNFQRRILWINITNMKDYSTPSFAELGSIHWREPSDTFAGTLTPNLSLRDKKGEIDGVVLAWREKRSADDGFDYVQRYIVTESIDCNIDLPNRQPLVHVCPGKYFFIRTYVFPEPSFGKWGPEETCH